MRTKVVGVTHGNRQEILEECFEGQDIFIQNKPSARYPHAMAVYVEDYDEEPQRRIGAGYLQRARRHR